MLERRGVLPEVAEADLEVLDQSVKFVGEADSAVVYFVMQFLHRVILSLRSLSEHCNMTPHFSYDPLVVLGVILELVDFGTRGFRSFKSLGDFTTNTLLHLLDVSYDGLLHFDSFTQVIELVLNVLGLRRWFFQSPE